MKKPAIFLAGVGICVLAVASYSTTAPPTPAPQPGPPENSAQFAPGAMASPTIDPDTTLTSKDGQSGPSTQSGQEADSSVVIIAQFVEGMDGETTLASINEAVALVFPGGYISVKRGHRNVLKGYALRAPAGSIDVIRVVSGVQVAYPDGNNLLQ